MISRRLSKLYIISFGSTMIVGGIEMFIVTTINIIKETENFHKYFIEEEKYKDFSQLRRYKQWYWDWIVYNRFQLFIMATSITYMIGGVFLIDRGIDL